MKKGLDCYYKPAEWFALPEATREKIIGLRDKRKISEVEIDDTSDSGSDPSTEPKAKSRKKKAKSDA
jgi:hypothetical protein